MSQPPVPELSGGKSELEASVQWMKLSEYEKATDSALQALQAADETDDRLLKAQALVQLSSIDLLTWRDSQAWDNACEAEGLASELQNDTLRADALVNKGKVCVYANVSGAESRDDEAIGYFEEALSYSSESPARQVDILYNISQAWINKNRLNSPPDQEMYRQAGEALDRADSIAIAHGLDALRARSVLYKIRYFRQGGRIQESIDCCREVLASIAEDDYLMQSQIYSQLVALYAETGDIKASAEAHQDYANATQFYMGQKSDLLLQEMESKYDAAQKEFRIRELRRDVVGLIVVIVLMGGLTCLLLFFVRRIHLQKKEISAADRAKEQLLALVSRELTAPESAGIRKDAKRFATMTDDEIHDYCSGLFKGNDNPLGDEVADYIIRLQDKKRSAVKDVGLTPREMDVIRCCREGLSNVAIAERLSISLSTVKNHKQSIFSKLGVYSVSEMLSELDKRGIS